MKLGKLKWNLSHSKSSEKLILYKTEQSYTKLLYEEKKRENNMPRDKESMPERCACKTEKQNKLCNLLSKNKLKDLKKINPHLGISY